MKGRRPDTSKLRVVPKSLFPNDIEVGEVVLHEECDGAFNVYYVSEGFVILSSFIGEWNEPVFQSDKKYKIGEITVQVK